MSLIKSYPIYTWFYPIPIPCIITIIVAYLSFSFSLLLWWTTRREEEEEERAKGSCCCCLLSSCWKKKILDVDKSTHPSCDLMALLPKQTGKKHTHTEKERRMPLWDACLLFCWSFSCFVYYILYRIWEREADPTVYYRIDIQQYADGDSGLCTLCEVV